MPVKRWTEKGEDGAGLTPFMDEPSSFDRLL
jgi:hypothetical protein